MGIETRPKIDTSICPLCGQPNDCAMTADPKTTRCWCKDLEFPRELFDLIPENALHQTCICRDCVDRFILEREAPA